MIERIKAGVKPTDILRELNAKNPEMNNYELSDIFHENFIGISGEAKQAIWYWKEGRKSEGGYSDNQLDEILMKALREAGLLE